MTTAPSDPAGAASARSRAATWCTTIVYWLRSSSASAKTYGSSSPAQNSASVHQNAATPLVRPVTYGRPVMSSGVGGAVEADRGEGRGGQSEPGVQVSQVVVQPDVGVVQEQQVLALDGEDQRLGVQRAPAQHSGA